MKQPKNDAKYVWTNHAWEKMQQYGISEQRVKRIVRFPKRTEEGVLDGAIAAMQPAGKQEMWVMYVIENTKADSLRNTKKEGITAPEKKLDNMQQFFGSANNKRFTIITVWRYPGVSKVRESIPDDILAEIQGMI